MEVQYLVKWLSWSHLHNTWETGEARRWGRGSPIQEPSLTSVLYLLLQSKVSWR